MRLSLSRRQILAGASCLALPALHVQAQAASARVALLHLNDFHSRHEGAQPAGAVCRVGAPCAGGSARLVGAMLAARQAAQAEGRATLALDAGDQALGSLFYTQHRGLAEAAVQRAWGVQAMAPGNHEFNLGPASLARYLRALGAPLLAANLDTRAEPALDGLVAPYAVFMAGGARIAVVGLALESTPQVSSPGPNLRFGSAEEAALRAIAELRASGPATIVMLSHRGVAADRAMAEAVPGIDVIIGGHSHTLLAEPELVAGRERAVRIVQVGALGRWAGRLDLDLGAAGQVLAHAGGAREITPETPEDPRTAALIDELARPLIALRARPVTEAAPGFDLATCRAGECAIGNLLAEALLEAVPGADVAMTNAGGIRTGLPAGQVTFGDVLNVLPFSNTVATARLRGVDLLAALEHGLSRGGGAFPQVAGIALDWAPQAPAGSRLLGARITQGAKAGPVRPEGDYLLVTNNFLRGGGDGYAMLRDRALEAYDGGPPLEDSLAAFMGKAGRIAPSVDGRINPR